MTTHMQSYWRKLGRGVVVGLFVAASACGSDDKKEETAAGPCDNKACCPTATGKSTAVLEIKTAGTFASGDALTFAMWTSWPPTGAPSVMDVIATPASFPYTLISKSIPAGSFQMYVCLDKGNDSLSSPSHSCTDAAGDYLAYYPALSQTGGSTGTQSFAADTAVLMTFDLDSDAVSLTSTKTSAEMGCP